jgi:hypothetical protein
VSRFPLRRAPASAAHDARTEATVQWLTFGGVERPRDFPLEHRVCNLFWSQEMWAWSAEQLAANYRAHREAVDALARAAGLPRAWVLDALAPNNTTEGSS